MPVWPGSPDPTPVTPGHRNRRIDLLRGIAILLVLFHHFCIAYPLGHSALGTLLTPEGVRAVARNGNYGVTLFFVISGFLITSNTLARYGSLAAIKARTFYAFRIARIVPCLLLLLALVNGLALAGVPIFATHIPGLSPLAAMMRANLAALTFSMNVFIAHYDWANYALGVLWSLSVEEVFYLTFPLVALVLRRPPLIMLFWALVAVVGPFYRMAHQGDESGFLFAYLASFDGIAIGCMAAVVATHWRLDGLAARLLQPAVIAGMVALYLWKSIGATNIWGVSAMALGTAVLLIASAHHANGPLATRSRLLRGVEWTGRLSYELYLFHLIILGLLRTMLPPGTVPQTGFERLAVLPVFLIGSGLLASLISRTFSEPLNRTLRQRLGGAQKTC
ncbi:acyltransferase family protein [Acetobacter cerevisiae]|uniref:acyltransferase family protein n=1 Tax=Acetobacter cerevisiae TaxID=178900 RepID=UPI00209EC23C|nr:acyltransferase [Acetobacter cerevisiae]MCP1271733.1 acyltransferase [Acetobacter cerevisiae]MCP1279688.1 acyltransferase [Acetobacter cerevisiae]